MDFNEFSNFLKYYELKRASQHFDNYQKSIDNKDYEGSLTRLRKMMEAIKDKLYQDYNLGTPHPSLANALERLFSNNFANQVFDFSKIPEDNNDELKKIYEGIKNTVLAAVKITNIGPHNTSDPTLIKKYYNTTCYVYKLISVVFPYLFRILLRSKIKKPIISKLEDIKNLIPLVEESVNFKFERDLFECLINREALFTDKFKDIYDNEGSIVQHQDGRNYDIVEIMIEKTLRDLKEINRNNDEALENEYICIKTRLFLRKGFSYRMWGQQDINKYEKSIITFENAIEISKNIIEKELQKYYELLCYCSLADILKITSRLKESKKSINNAKSFEKDVKANKFSKIKNLCLGLFYNQLSLINFQEGITKAKKVKFFKNILKTQNDSIWYFYKLKHKKQMYKSIIDLCSCFYEICLINNCLDSVSNMIEFLENLPNPPSETPEHQYSHNLASLRAKFLSLNFEDESNLKKAEHIISESIELSRRENQERAYGAELVILGEIQLFLLEEEKMNEGIENIKKGLEKLKNHQQVRLISKFELKQTLKKIERLDCFSSEKKQKIRNELSEFVK